ncbi:nuclear transport factor 2 family protein [Nakamurella lactea]|uniref:nuclear transport factor 2 family protein n=1 Tax=Nakamurella lactea TaxID=459515 RepID=UPI000406757F|nr:nuclear transport factor 2 family protein [Nakamurella lactea]
MSGPELPAELLRAADIVLIIDSIARIAQLADEGELDSYLALFTEDAVWTMPANPATGVDRQLRTGRADLRAGAAERRGAGIQGPGSWTRHVVTGTSVRVHSPDDGGPARQADALSYFRFYVDTRATPRLVSMGSYRDVFRRTSDGWLLATRTIGLG